MMAKFNRKTSVVKYAKIVVSVTTVCWLIWGQELRLRYLMKGTIESGQILNKTGKQNLLLFTENESNEYLSKYISDWLQLGKWLGFHFSIRLTTISALNFRFYQK